MTSSVTFKNTKNEAYDFKAIFQQLINMEHFRALVSDGFWYFICQEFKETS